MHHDSCKRLQCKLWPRSHRMDQGQCGRSLHRSCSHGAFNSFYLFIFYFFISIFFISKVDLHLAYKNPINVNNNTAYTSVNKLPINNDNNKTEYLIVRQNQHVANRLYITYMGNHASTFLFFVWKILDYHNFLLFREQVTTFLELCKIWYHILQN